MTKKGTVNEIYSTICNEIDEIFSKMAFVKLSVYICWPKCFLKILCIHDEMFKMFPFNSKHRNRNVTVVQRGTVREEISYKFASSLSKCRHIHNPLENIHRMKKNCFAYDSRIENNDIRLHTSFFFSSQTKIVLSLFKKLLRMKQEWILVFCKILTRSWIIVAAEILWPAPCKSFRFCDNNNPEEKKNKKRIKQ